MTLKTLNSQRLIISAAWVATVLVLAPIVRAAGFVAKYPTMAKPMKQSVSRGPSDSHLSPELRRLAHQFPASRVKSVVSYSPAQLRSRFGIAPGDKSPTIAVAVRCIKNADTNRIANSLVDVYGTVGSRLMGTVSVSRLEALASAPGVRMIDPAKSANFPKPPPRTSHGFKLPSRDQTMIPVAFDHQGLTGKGVCVGIVDSGIDWRHADFRDANGKTRIAAIWDLYDDSYAKSNGKIGTKPPQDYKNAPLGTVYTRDQINAALAVGGKPLGTADTEGHGTACAGTAAGNGGGTKYTGIATDADLIVVRAGKGEGISGLYLLGVQWIVDTAKSLGEPVVINQSFGSQDSAHDGTEAEETTLNEICGAGKPGVVICAAAGNEGQASFHAAGRYGPKREGQIDNEAELVTLVVDKSTELDAYLKASDDWGLAIVGLDKFMVDKNGKTDIFYITKTEGGCSASTDSPVGTPADLKAWWDSVVSATSENGEEEHLTIPLEPGKYYIYAFGSGPNVTDGTFDLYLPFIDDALFGRGTVKQYMVATPGNADNVITVGAYDFRGAWPSLAGHESYVNLDLGAVSSYSSPGFRRGGSIKPEIVAPGTYALSTYAAGSAIGLGSDDKPDPTIILPDGKHVAWSGTSAATPYVTGVVALMLQKNPDLDAAQIKQILTSTAKGGPKLGTVPNTFCGYGKIDPAAAIAATPAK